MRRRDKSATDRSADDAVDPLEDALRQIGEDILNEPVPEALRRVLRGGSQKPGPELGHADGDRRRRSRRD